MQFTVLTPSPDCDLDWRPSFEIFARGLSQAGLEVRSCAWNAFDGQSYATPILAWGYHLQNAEWFALLATAKRLINPASVLAWNSNKKYLADVDQFAPIVPTIFVEAVNAQTLANAAAQLQTNDLIIKPESGASAYGVRRLRADEESEISGSLLVQPYVASIQSEGEISLIFLGGRFSHAVRKRPKAGEFRVQTEWGGSVENIDPDHVARTVATKALSGAPAACAYARVDLVRLGDTWAVMELEIIEPELFLNFSEGAGRAFADAIVAQMRSNSLDHDTPV